MRRSLTSNGADGRRGSAPPDERGPATARVARSLTWLAVAVCCLYALFAVLAAGDELLAILGVTVSVVPRVLPPVFVVHALTGGVALIAGAVQLRLGPPRTPRRARLHRLLGYHYVIAALVTSLLGPLLAARFDVGLAGTALFALWAALWITATLLAVHRARARRFVAHRRWMARSYALAAVFVTFDFIRMALNGAGLDRAAVYPLALAISGTLNVAVAEVWLRRAAWPRRALPVPRAEREVSDPGAVAAGGCRRSVGVDGVEDEQVLLEHAGALKITDQPDPAGALPRPVVSVRPASTPASTPWRWPRRRRTRCRVSTPVPVHPVTRGRCSAR